MHFKITRNSTLDLAKTLIEDKTAAKIEVAYIKVNFVNDRKSQLRIASSLEHTAEALKCKKEEAVGVAGAK